MTVYWISPRQQNDFSLSHQPTFLRYRFAGSVAYMYLSSRDWCVDVEELKAHLYWRGTVGHDTPSTGQKVSSIRADRGFVFVFVSVSVCARAFDGVCARARLCV